MISRASFHPQPFCDTPYISTLSLISNFVLPSTLLVDLTLCVVLAVAHLASPAVSSYLRSAITPSFKILDVIMTCAL